MAFILAGQTVISYADFNDVADTDQRVFQSNEIDFSNAPDDPATISDYVEDLATKATNRINEKIRASAQWRHYMGVVGITYSSSSDIPQFVPSNIKSRQSAFTDMCVYYTLKEYIYPKLADFGNPESPEVQKIEYFENKFNELFIELTSMWDWYDADGSGTVDDSERMIRYSSTRRSRGRRSIVRVR